MRKIFVFYTVLFFCTILNATPRYSLTKTDITDINVWKCAYSDSAEFANPQYDDGNWAEKKIEGLWEADENGAKGIRWFRSKIFVRQDIRDFEKATIFIPIVISAYQIYWDGVKIGENGKVGDKKESEIIGNSTGIFFIPQYLLSTGEHILAIRTSNFSLVSGFVAEPPKIGFFENIISHYSKTLSFSSALVGIFLITAFFNIIFIAKSLNVRAHIIYAIFSLCCSGSILMPLVSGYYSINLKHYYLMTFVRDLFEIGILASLPIYLLRLFDAKHIMIKVSAIITTSTIVVMLPQLAIYGIVPVHAITLLSNINKIFTMLSVIISIVITLEALFKKEKGAKTITIGLIIFGICILFSIIFNQINVRSLGFASLSVFITMVIGRFFWEEMQKKSLMEIKNARLELELLKNNIQPHFLLNSLNSIVAWIEEDPKIAGKLVNELSKELRLLMSFSEKKTISLTEEISLCNAHINVMNLRREKDIKLKISGNIEGITIPPLILHTALENGFTHGFIKKDTGVFDLNVTIQTKKIIILLKNNGENKPLKNQKSTGTGNKYIIQRLAETYKNKFKFVSEPIDDGWQVIFEIPAEGMEVE